MELKEYMVELNKIEVLLPEQEKKLWQAYKDRHDMESRRSLIESYQPLVFKQAMRFRFFENIMDVIQEGTVGLIEAVENYDYELGAAFSLYAVHRIRGRMLNFLKKEGNCDIATLDALIGSEDGGTAVDTLIDTAAAVPEQAEKSFLAEQLQKALERLPQKEREVLSGVYLESREPREMAESMDVSTSHIYRLQKTGIRRVRGMLSKLMQHW